VARSVVTPKGRAARIEGLPELQAKITKILDRTTGKQVKRVWMDAALVLRDAARGMAPVLKKPHKGHVAGLLKSAIFAAYGDPAKPNVLVGVNYRIAPYARLVEYGGSKKSKGPRMTGDIKGRPTGNRVQSTGYMTAQPFMRPALTATRSKCVAIIAEGYQKLIEEAAS
jgi:HK97 gp10 family phage protein